LTLIVDSLCENFPKTQVQSLNKKLKYFQFNKWKGWFINC